MGAVNFHHADVVNTPLFKRKLLKEFLRHHLIKSEGFNLSALTYVFTSDDYLLTINKNFLDHDYYTDVITFNFSTATEIDGEAYISIPRVKENAKIHSAPFQTELLRVIFHAALHLCGYNDKKKSEITVMREKEDYYLRLFEKQIKKRTI